GLLGVGGAFLLFNGLTASTLGAGFTQVVFAFKVTPDSVVQGVGLALIIGVLGGLAPGLRAARAPLLAVNAA
ncbi:MAG TPA: peptide ABC transporter permease, partial [Hyphomonadaceae bacterium]|nr:peptide ABC transporter permease [Hyphomonadaceae bacterium]